MDQNSGLQTVTVCIWPLLITGRFSQLIHVNNWQMVTSDQINNRSLLTSFSYNWQRKLKIIRDSRIPVNSRELKTKIKVRHFCSIDKKWRPRASWWWFISQDFEVCAVWWKFITNERRTYQWNSGWLFLFNQMRDCWLYFDGSEGTKTVENWDSSSGKVMKICKNMLNNLNNSMK